MVLREQAPTEGVVEVVVETGATQQTPIRRGLVETLVVGVVIVIMVFADLPNTEHLAEAEQSA
jgi:hypothetical protein